jgi:hypothetical protein
MVDWFSPSQLARTAGQVVLSTIFERFGDRRLLEALGPHGGTFDDHSSRTAITIDYLADTGDGWHSTFAMASLVARAKLSIRNIGDAPAVTLPSADVVVLGGDEVYPTPSRRQYEDRLVGPFETAKAWSPDAGAPSMYALPGNHDWYDGLVSFHRLFINKKWFGGWRVPQERSYFALKLPHRWWLAAVDMQLDSDLDLDQLEYFRQVATNMADGDRLILCVAEPHWIYQHERDRGHWDAPPPVTPQPNCPAPYISNLEFLEKEIFARARTRIMLAGDLHHYRRHEGPGGAQKITSGGGGAFLHPTHTLPTTTLAGGFEAKPHTWPPVKASRRLAWSALLLGWRHPRFAALIGACYTVLGWAVLADFREIPVGIAGIPTVVAATVSALVTKPGAVALVVIMFLGFVMFSDANRRLFRWTVGLTHATLHLAVCVLLGWVAVSTTVGWGFRYLSASQLLVAGGLMFGAGAVVGSTLFGVYLVVSMWLGFHSNEGFSNLGVPDWKHFLRMRIDERGQLTIYPIGLRTVPRAWRATKDGDPSAPRLEPADDALDPELIEPPIVVRP